MTKTSFVKEQKAKQDKLLKQLAGLLGGVDNLDKWLNLPHPVLDHKTPQSYVDQGKLEVLEYFINAIETGQPS
jgi:uncharacterized protein (DUF2384 family)